MTQPRNGRLVLTQNVREGNDGLVIGIGGGTVGDKAGIPFCIGGTLTDLMGNRFAEACSILGHKGNDVTFLQGGRIGLFHEDQRACVKIRCCHRVGIYNIHFITEQATVVSVKGGAGDHGKDHHKHRKKHHEPYEGVL